MALANNGGGVCAGLMCLLTRESEDDVRIPQPHPDTPEQNLNMVKPSLWA